MNSLRAASRVAAVISAALLALGAVHAARSGTVSAAPPKDPIRWVAKYEDAFTEARERNVPIVLGIIQDGEKENERMVIECYENKSYIKLTRMAVNLIGSRGSSDRHGILEQEVDGRVRKLCKKYGSVTCFEHQDIDLAAFKDYSDEGEIHTPHHVIIHPVDRRVLGRADDHIDRTDLMAKIRRAQSEVGAGLSPEQYDDVRDRLAKIDTALKLSEYGTALEHLLEIVEIDAGGTLMERARKEHAATLEIGKSLLAAAEEHAENREFSQMYVKLKTLKTDFKPIKDLYRASRKLEGKYRSDPEARRAEKALKLEPKARVLLEKAEKELKLENYVAAIASLQGIVDQYADTPSAYNAAKILARLEGDEEIGKLVVEQRMKAECTRWLREAKSHQRNGRPDMARESCQQILDAYPDSSYAGEARELLAELD